LKTGDYPRESYTQMFLASPCFDTHAISRNVIKIQATHNWTVKTSLKKTCRIIVFLTSDV